MEPKWRRGHGAVGPGAKTSWWLLTAPAAPASGRAPRAAPTFRRPPWGTPLRTRQEVVHRQRLERWPHLRGSEGSTETNIWEGSTLLHLQKKAGRRSEAFPGSRLADKTKKAGSGGAGRPRGGPFPEGPSACAGRPRAGTSATFSWKPATLPPRPRTREAPTVLVSQTSPHPCGSQGFTRKPLNISSPRPALAGLPFPGTLRPRPPAAPPGAHPREARSGVRLGSLGTPLKAPLPERRTCETMSIRFLRPSPTGPRPRAPRAGDRKPRGRRPAPPDPRGPGAPPGAPARRPGSALERRRWSAASSEARGPRGGCSSGHGHTRPAVPRGERPAVPCRWPCPR